MARIAFLLPNMQGGGAERVALALIDEFLARGHDIDLVLMRAEGELMDTVPEAVKVIDLGVSRFRKAHWPLVRYLRDRKPDALQASLWPLTASAIAARVAARSRTRVVVSDHITLSRQYGGSRSAMAAIRATTRLLYPLAQGRVCVSKGSAADLARLSGIPRERFTVIYNPIPAPRLAAGAAPGVERLWVGAKHRILSVGSLKEQKNHAVLIRALGLLGDDFPASLVILGEGELRDDLEQLAGELGVADRVAMPGFVLDPAPYFRTAGLFVLSSDYEGFGNVLVEAMHAGLPIVSTDCPDGPAEILEGGRYGRLVPPGDEVALAAAIGEALVDPSDGELLKRRARDFSAARAADAYLELLLGPNDRAEAIADRESNQPS